MGYIKHHAIAVTSSNDEQIELVHAKAKEILGGLVTPIVESNLNGYRSFFVAPDGSKEGWANSDDGDFARAALIKFINGMAYGDGSNSVSYAEFYYGEDNGQSEITNHN